ncbi:MAG: cobyrinate a,c-diamide synthase [Acidimicrobiales bacterium]
MGSLDVARIVVAGTRSGVGKTTVATGLMAAFSAAGTVTAAAKVGPDFIDPGYHSVAIGGRPSRNLDPFLQPPSLLPALAARAARGAQLLVVEGVMGLFDGLGSGREASTAHVAGILAAPVVLVVDAAGVGRSIAAEVTGYRSFDPAAPRAPALAGVVLNRVGSDRHEALLRESLSAIGMPVLGALRRDDRLAWRDRHLGLVPVAERPEAVATSLRSLSAVVADRLDLEAIAAIAASAPPVPAPALPRGTPAGRAVVAVASGRAFSFAYPDNLEALEDAGAELAFFDPTRDRSLPDGATALYAGGGFPEVYAGELASNRPLLEEVARRAGRDLVTWAECGGMLWLARSLGGVAMAGVLPATATMTGGPTLGYRRATVLEDNPVLRAGSVVSAHEHHYSSTSPSGSAMRVEVAAGGGGRREGFAGRAMLASYLHLHLGGDPRPAERFVCAASARASHGATGG